MGLLFDAILVLLALLFALNGLRKGLFRSLMGLIGAALALVLSVLVARLCAGFLYETVVAPPLHEFLTNQLVGQVSNGAGAAFYWVAESFGGAGTVASAAGMGVSSAMELMRPVLENILCILGTIVLFIPMMVVVKILVRLLNGVTKMPGLRTINRLLGCLFGLCKGVLILWLLCALVSASLPLLDAMGLFGICPWIAEILNGSALYHLLSSINPLELVLQ